MSENAPILLVEDNEDDVLFMRRAARHANVTRTFSVVSDGQAAMDYLAGNAEYSDREKYPLPCFVLLDLKLPYKSGLEVLEWIRQQTELRPLPVIMFTSSGEPADVERAYRLGANGYVVKPSNMEQLIGIVRSISAFWLEQNLLPGINAGRTRFGRMNFSKQT